MSVRNSILAVALVAGLAGCHQDKPHGYGTQRPPVDQLDPEDRGLQSKDIVTSSDAMANSLLTDVPELHSSPTRSVIVVDRAENLTANQRQNMDIFLERVRVRLAQLGRGKVQLVENRDKLRQLQSQELETGGGQTAPGPAGLQPDFSLYARIIEMPNRRTSYFMCEFTLTAIRDTPQHRAREQVWTNMYEVKVNN